MRKWDDYQKATAIRILGLCIAVFTVCMLLSSISYLFTWREDQSLLTDPSMIDPSVVSRNSGGKLGFKLGYLLVCKWFGLGSFALVFIPVSVSVRLLADRWSHSLLKTTIIALTGAFLSSLILSFIGDICGLANAFGGGLGGQCGSYLIMWAENLFGPVISLSLLLVFLFLWLFFSSRKFGEWLRSLENKSADAEMVQDSEVSLGDESDASIPDAQAERGLADEVELLPPDEPLIADDEFPANLEAGEVVPVDSEIEVIEGEGFSTEIEKPLPRIDIRAEEVPNYKFPDLELLDAHSESRRDVSSEELTRNNNKIRASLSNFKIQIVDVKAVVGPTVTLYKVYPAPGVRINDIKRLQDDIAMSLNARGVRVVTLDDSVGIEVANDNPSIVPVRAMLNDKSFRESKAELPVAIGYTITQKVKTFDLADTPHLLIAGATKQGKSVGLNVVVSSLLYSKHPSELKLVFIDPKMVEFSSYSRLLKHYLAVLPDSLDDNDERNNAIVKKAKDAEKILRSLCIEMDERYELLSSALVNNIKLYNEKYKDRHLLPTKGHHFLPYLVVIIDEYADLTMSVGGSAENRSMAKSIQTSIIRLAQKGRAAGIHVILATQRPSVDVISGVIKTNFPTRIAFRVASRTDSMTILDTPGAEKLIGKGDMLYYAGVDTERIQCAYISNDEINSITKYIGAQTGFRQCYNTPYYLPSPSPEEGDGAGMIDMGDLDERFEEAARLVVMNQKGSTSDLQRRLGMGYAKAGRVMDQLEAAGIVGPQEGSKPRQVLVPDLNSLEPILKAFLK